MASEERVSVQFFFNFFVTMFLTPSGYSFDASLSHQPLWIIDEIDWQDVTTYPPDSPEYRNAQAVALLLLRNGVACTGFLVSKDILMTNRHCVKNQQEATDLIAVFNHEIGVDASQWEIYYCGTFMAAWGVRPIPILQEQDVALIRCRPDRDGKLPGDKRWFLPLTPDFPNPPNIYLIHHPCKPASNTACDEQSQTPLPKKISPGSTRQGRIGRRIVPFRIQHTADMMPNSSGGPIFDAKTHRVFAINAQHFNIPGVDLLTRNFGTWFSKLNPPLVLANPGPDQKATVGVPLTLDGSNSVALFPPLSYTWKFIKNPQGSKPKLENPQTANPTFAADKPGDYILELIVKDGRGNYSRNRKTNKVKITTTALEACTITVSPGQLIQAAIDAAAESAVICLTAGTWQENLVIQKSLTLRGSGAEQTIIKGLVPSETSISIVTDSEIEVKLMALTIAVTRGACLHFPDQCNVGITVLPSSTSQAKVNKVNIYNVVVSGNDWGVIVGGLTKANIQNTQVTDNNAPGVTIGDSAEVTIQNSNVSNNRDKGLYVFASASVILQNSLVNSNLEGMEVLNTANMTILNSEISFNRFNGVLVAESTQVTVKDSTIRNNDGWGVVAVLKKCGFDLDLFTGYVAFQGNNTIEGNKKGQVCLPDSPSSSNQPMIFRTHNESVKDIQLFVFNLSGRLVFHTDWVDNGFEWNLFNDRGQRLANGVYLYVVYIRRWDGSIIRSEVKKLVILR